jgi:isopenicillin N synthase-like dioxygenase
MAPLLHPHGTDALHRTAAAINTACRDNGFFYIKNHGVDEGLQHNLEKLSHDFFALSENEKMKISMSRGGRAWRGYFPVEGELTSGMPDLKEGIYFGQELSEADPRVKAGLPLHGRNLFPERPNELKETVLQYMEALTRVGHALMKGIALSLGLEPDYFHTRYTADPLILFRIFHYPAQKTAGNQWGVGEHTDYGVLTILKQDDAGGLQVKSRGEWIDARLSGRTLGVYRRNE